MYSCVYANRQMDNQSNVNGQAQQPDISGSPCYFLYTLPLGANVALSPCPMGNYSFALITVSLVHYIYAFIQYYIYIYIHTIIYTLVSMHICIFV